MTLTKKQLNEIISDIINEEVHPEEKAIESALNSLDIDEPTYNFNKEYKKDD